MHKKRCSLENEKIINKTIDSSLLGEKTKGPSSNTLLLFAGASIALIAGLLGAFVPGIAYATVYVYFLDGPNPYGLPEVVYESLIFSSHIYTARLVMSAMGGLIGLFALFPKKKVYIGVGAIAVASFGLMLPAFNDMRGTISEVRLVDTPWIGGLVIILGICLMFLGLTLKNDRVPKASFLGVPMLLTVSSIQPILVAFNCLPRAVFGLPTPTLINVISWFVFFAAVLLLIWGSLWPYRNNLKKRAVFETAAVSSQTADKQ
jgi:hypothetical protein